MLVLYWPPPLPIKGIGLARTTTDGRDCPPVEVMTVEEDEDEDEEDGLDATRILT